MQQGAHAAYAIDPEVPSPKALARAASLPEGRRFDQDRLVRKGGLLAVPLDRASSLQLKYLSGKSRSENTAVIAEQQVSERRLSPADKRGDVAT